jgi:S-adenosylmethionine:tRNA ribosyltransferase-isomerase
MFDFEPLPHLIAQQPCHERDQARLLVVDRTSKAITHHIFCDLPDLLNPGDLLVLNNSRVVPARLVGHRIATGGKWQGLYLRTLPDGAWEMLCQTRGRLAEGDEIAVDPSPLQLRLLAKQPTGTWLVRPSEEGDAVTILTRFGHVPLPPYIRKGAETGGDRERYQTVYARPAGSVAAPTAGLHFTPRAFDRLRQRGIAWAFVTLHVGAATFLPLPEGDISKHQMHREWAELPAETAAEVMECRRRGGKVVAVGTTSVRVLETAGAAGGMMSAWSGETDLFIRPPYTFHSVDALVTNFHQPRTSLLLLVSALAGEDLLRDAYQAAVENGYRFYSYGDAMLIR